MDWIRQNIILTIIGAMISIALMLGGWFAQRLVNETDAKPNKDEVILMIKSEMIPIINEMTDHNTRLIKLENSIMAIGSINTKLDNLVTQQNKMSIDIAVIKTKINQK